MCSFPFKILFIIIFGVVSCSSAEYIPVFIWQTATGRNHSGQSPLTSTSHISFRNIMLNALDKNSSIVIFLMYSLSPEDFILRNNNGETIFETLNSFLDIYNVTYLPYVRNPVSTIQSIGEDFKEESVASILGNYTLFKKKILIIRMNDTRIDENRKDMFTRDDFIIFKIHSQLLQVQGNILGVVTARHMSWVTPEGVTHHVSKKLLQNMATAKPKSKRSTEPTTIIVDDKNLLLVTSGNAKHSKDNEATFKSTSLSQTGFTIQDKNMKLTLTGTNVILEFSFNTTMRGYWKIVELTLNKKKVAFGVVEAPMGFSYHCTKFKLRNSKEKEVLVIPGFQVQPFKEGKDKPKFGSAYDCTGFTSVPILCGIFIIALILSVFFCGIMFMMDMGTMDKYDDPSEPAFRVTEEHS